MKNKNDIDWNSVRESLSKRLKRNYYHGKKEWQYKNIEPCIIGEKLLINTNGELPMDYKIHCFHGKVEVIQVDIDRFTNHKRNFYDQSWNLLPFSWSLWKDGQPLWNTGRALEKPKNLDEMISVAEKLSEVFKYVRIDLYDFENKIHNVANGMGILELLDKKLEVDEKFNHADEMRHHRARRADEGFRRARQCGARRRAARGGGRGRAAARAGRGLGIARRA